MHDSKHDTRFDSSGAFSPKKRASPGTGSWGCFLRRPRLSFSSPYHYLPLLCSYNIIYNNGFHLRCFRICCVVLHVRVLTGISTLLRVHLNIFIGSGLWRTLLLRLPVPDHPWVRVNGMFNALDWSFDFDLRDMSME